jgi:8-oxo-dGTP pyrophosphatase MutT (NUDIX family)
LKSKSIKNFKKKLKICSNGDAKAAVAVIFKETDRGMELLLVKRAEVLGDPWSGDMAFPGGKRIPIDQDMLQTVVREVKEETNISLNTNVFLGSMDIVFSIVRPEYDILPMVFLQTTEPQIKINEELTSFLWVSFDDLEDSRSRAIVKNLDVPVFNVGREMVWGLTYRIIDKILELSKED